MKEITDLQGFESCLNASHAAPLLIFKHSTSCAISAAAHENVQRFLRKPNLNCPEVYLVKVIESRPVSNEIASRFSVPHQSPQIILVRDSKPIWGASHWGITVEAIESALEMERSGPERTAAS